MDYINYPVTPDELAEATADRHPGTAAVVRWFAYDHLPPDNRRMPAVICQLVTGLLVDLPDSPELTTGLRKLLEAKDCLTRAAVEASDYASG